MRRFGHGKRETRSSALRKIDKCRAVAQLGFYDVVVVNFVCPQGLLAFPGSGTAPKATADWVHEVFVGHAEQIRDALINPGITLSTSPARS